MNALSKEKSHLASRRAAGLRVIGAAFAAVALVAQTEAPLIVTLTISVEESPRPTITGQTNLASGTRLLVSIDRLDISFQAQARAVVQNGAFRVGPFSRNGEALLPGSYDVKVTISHASVQPDRVREQMGDDGRNLAGPLMRPSVLGGRTVELTSIFVISGARGTTSENALGRRVHEETRRWQLESCNAACGAAFDRRSEDYRRCNAACTR